MPRLDRLDVQLLFPGLGAGEGKGVTLHARDVRPDRDFTFDVEGASSGALRANQYAVARVEPIADSGADASTNAARIDGLVIAFDTSASRALGFSAQVDQLGALVAALHPKSLRVACFDQDVREMYRGDAKGFGSSQIAEIKARRALGASNVHAALAWANGAAQGAHATRVLFVTDGVVTAGPLEGDALRSDVAALRAAGVTRLDVLVDGGIRDEALARDLVTAGLPSQGVVAAASLGADAIARKIRARWPAGSPSAVPGATWAYPATLDSVQPGDAFSVYADLPAASPFTIALGGPSPSLARARARAIATKTADGPLLERAVARAHIEKGRWATAWASSRSSSTTAPARCASRSVLSWS